MGRILVADDDPIFCEIIVEELEDCGHLVSAVHDGAEVLDAVDIAIPDVLVLDCAMPGQNGVQIIKALHEAGSRTRILVVTSRRNPAYLRQLEQIGANAVMVKPLEHGEISEKVAAFLD